MRAYKTEINPTDEQKRIIHQTLGVCRFIYNFYLAHNKEMHTREKRFVSGMEFSKKYIARAGKKDPNKTVEDLQKAAWYINCEIERMEK